MDERFRVLVDGTLYLEHGRIVAVSERGAAPPAGFEDVAVVETGGTVFRG